MSTVSSKSRSLRIESVSKCKTFIKRIKTEVTRATSNIRMAALGLIKSIRFSQGKKKRYFEPTF